MWGTSGRQPSGWAVQCVKSEQAAHGLIHAQLSTSTAQRLHPYTVFVLLHWAINTRHLTSAFEVETVEIRPAQVGQVGAECKDRQDTALASSTWSVRRNGDPALIHPLQFGLSWSYRAAGWLRYEVLFIHLDEPSPEVFPATLWLVVHVCSDAFTTFALCVYAPLCSSVVSERRQLLARHASYMCIHR